METAFTRTRWLLGDAAMQRLEKAHVAIFGLGGVGSFAAEALGRSGIGALSLFDHDTVSITNLNRQLIATCETIGQRKVDVMQQRLGSINPHMRVQAHAVFTRRKTRMYSICAPLTTWSMPLIPYPASCC